MFKCDDDIDVEERRLNTLPLGAAGNTNEEKSLVETECTSDMTSTTDEGTFEELVIFKFIMLNFQIIDVCVKSDDNTHATDDLSMESESCASSTTSGISDAASSYSAYRKSGGKRSRYSYICELRSRRSFLFNKLVQLMPSNMVQPERNLSDFVII